MDIVADVAVVGGVVDVVVVVEGLKMMGVVEGTAGLVKSSLMGIVVNYQVVLVGYYYYYYYYPRHSRSY